MHPLGDLRRGFRRGGLLRLDGGLDGEVLRLLAHQDCGPGHRKDNSKNDRRRDPEQAFRLGGFGARRNRALHLRLRSGRQAGTVELRRHFGRVGPLHRFIVTARDDGRSVERAPVVGLVRSDRFGRVERRQSGQTFILAVRCPHRRSGPSGPRYGRGLVGHCSCELGSCRRSYCRPRCGWPPRNRGWRLRRAPGWLGPPLRGGGGRASRPERARLLPRLGLARRFAKAIAPKERPAQARSARSGAEP